MDLILFNRTSNELYVKKFRSDGDKGLEYNKTIVKDAEIVEDLTNGVGVFVTWVESSTHDGYFDIYVAATVKNNEGK